MDVTSDTVAASNLLSGYTAHDKSGSLITGTASAGGASPTLQTKSATPTESAQTITADSGYDGLSSVEIGAISGTYVGSQVPTQAAQTIHPSTSAQTIASGKYLTGDQTIEAVTTTNLTAANIKSGVVVKVGSATDDDSVLSLTGTATSSLIVTFSYNETTEQWEPNITFAEIQAAYTAGEEIGMNTSNVDINGHCSFDPYENRFYYDIVEYNYSTNKLNYLYYYYDDNGVHPDDSGSYISEKRLIAKTITANGTYNPSTDNAGGYSSVTVNVQPSLQSKSATPSETAQTITADNGYDGLSQVSVGAISSTYVGSGIDRNDSSDLTTSGATVSVPAGYYAEAATKSVASGTAGTPSATKGTVSNHSVSVTPSVTNTTGYITGGTKTGTAVTVSASELVSGTKSITSNGTGIDVTNYAAVNVALNFSTITVSSSNPTGGNNGDIWIKTVS